LLYYARAVDNTLHSVPLPPSKQTNGEDESNNQTTVRLLCNAGRTSDCIQSQKNDPCRTQQCRILQQKEFTKPSGRTFFPIKQRQTPPNNGATLTIATFIKAVMSSAAEAELGSLYLNAREAVYLWRILTEMGHPQLQTPIQTNNSMAKGVINIKIQPK
jgi:hypothetical protein